MATGKPTLVRDGRWLAFVIIAMCVAMIAFSLGSLFAPGSDLIPGRRTAVDVLVPLAIILTFPVVGSVVVWKRPRNPIGWLFLAVGLSMTASVFATEYPGRVAYAGADLPGAQLVAWLGGSVWMVGPLVAMPVAIILFPDGRFPGSVWRRAMVVAITLAAIVIAASALIPGELDGWDGHFVSPVGLPGPLGGIARGVAEMGFVIALLPGLVAVAATTVRFRRAEGAERQQMKWLLYPVALFVAAMGAALVVQVDWLWTLALSGLAAAPIAAGIAILRYRLYDIDVLINRTLVYGVVSAILAAVYVASVIILQGLLSGFAGGGTVAVAISTLAVAGLFQPVRRRTQRAVDRRFYRSRYDAERTMQAFATRLRHEVDLSQLTDELRAAVETSLQPAAVTVWLRHPGGPT